MKKLFIAVALVILGSSLCYGQKMSVEQTIMKMEQEMTDAFLKGDASVFEKYTADNSAFIDPGGMLKNKSQLMAEFKSGDFKLTESKIDGMKVQMFGKTAIVTYTTMDKGTLKGRDISGRYRWTDTFVKMDGKWQMVASQGTPVMP